MGVEELCRIILSLSILPVIRIITGILRLKGLINQEVTSYIDRNRKELNANYKNVDKFIATFEVDEKMLQDLKSLAEKEKIKYNEEEFQKSLPLIKAQLKALIARDLFDMSAY